MKKQLLTSLLSLGLAAGAFAQSADSVVIFNGTADELANGTPYKFDNVTIEKDTNVSDLNVFLHLTGTKTPAGYAGGAGIAGYTSVGELKLLGYTGDVENSWLTFKVRTGGTSPALQIQFKTTDTLTNPVFGYGWNFSDSLDAQEDWQQISVPLSWFKLKTKAGAFDSTALADTVLWKATSEVQFVISTTGAENTVVVDIDDLIITSEDPTSVADDEIFTSASIYPNPNNTGVLHIGQTERTYSLMNATGAVVKAGVASKIDVANLERGIYFVRVGKYTQKVILN